MDTRFRVEQQNSRKNLYWFAGASPPAELFGDADAKAMSFADWQAKGVDQHSLVADPKFVDPANYDFRLQPDSPALKLGFQPIDTSAIGLKPDFPARFPRE